MKAESAAIVPTLFFGFHLFLGFFDGKKFVQVLAYLRAMYESETCHDRNLEVVSGESVLWEGRRVKFVMLNSLNSQRDKLYSVGKRS